MRFRRVKNTCWEEGHAKNTNALLAVMALHQPAEIIGTHKTQGLYCEGCNTDYYEPWPCPTVKLVEKELAR